MKIIKDGHTVYNSIDNTGSSNDAALGAQYAKGRLDTLDGRFAGYYTKTEVLDLLTGMASTYIVSELPASPDANTYYMAGNDNDGYVLHYYDSDFNHALVGSYDLDLSAVSPQKSVLPTASADYSGKVYQYIGTTQARYVRGKWYECRNQTYYAWLSTTSGTNLYTHDSAPSAGAYIYDLNNVRYAYNVASVSGNTMTDTGGGTWTRNSAADTSAYNWFDLADGALTTVWNSNLASSHALGTSTSGKIIAATATMVELNRLIGVTSPVQTQIDAKQDKLTAETVSSIADATKMSGVDLTNKKSKDTTALDLYKYMMNKMYPVGSIYISTTKTNPNTTLGVGTWSIVATNRVLWGVAESTNAGTELGEELPNIKGSVAMEIMNKSLSKSGVFKDSSTNSSGSREPNYGTGSCNWGSVEFDASDSSSVYKDNGVVRPAAYTVHIWKRTA